MDGETVETVTDFIFFGSKITINGDCSHKIKTLAPLKESYDKPRQHIKKQRHHFANKDLYSQKLCFFQGSCTDVEKAMAPHSSTLAWKILWTEEPGRLQSVGSQRVRHD